MPRYQSLHLSLLDYVFIRPVIHMLEKRFEASFVRFPHFSSLFVCARRREERKKKHREETHLAWE